MPSSPHRACWQAKQYDGDSAEAHAVTLRLGFDALEITRDGVIASHWPYEELKQTQGFYPNEPLRLEHGKEAVTVTDRSILDSVKTSKIKFGGTKGPLRGGRLALWLPIILIIGLSATALIYFKLIPTAANFIADIIPPTLEERLGSTTEKSFLYGYDEYDNQELTGAVEKILARLETAVGESPYDFKIKIIDAPIKNAFALPGGRIILFRGLIESTDTPEELAGVIAHEMVHVLRRHSTKGMLQQLSTYMLFSFMTGDVNTVTATAQNLGNMRYSREFETEADRLGTILLIESQIDPTGLGAFFKKVGEKEGMPSQLSYLSTHPMAGKRAEAIEQMTEPGTVYESLMPNIVWKDLTCAPSTKEDSEKNE